MLIILGGLGGEKDRWSEQADMLTSRHAHIVGDVLVAAGVVAYLGPFITHYRQV